MLFILFFSTNSNFIILYLYQLLFHTPNIIRYNTLTLINNSTEAKA
jgi:hypothetical protein